ncbi:YagK/YfjJ domain-containing protein [Aeromonas salmonicida]|uniref:YagK/YfjJ domain-containing protein n=1 Tax=Aeromonas salmonicida TaxID=645 RepID=UPI0035A6F524
MLIDILPFIDTLNKSTPPYILIKQDGTYNKLARKFQRIMDTVTEHYREHRAPISAHPSVELLLEHLYPFRDLDIFNHDLCLSEREELANELDGVLREFMDKLHSPQHNKRLCNLRRDEARNTQTYRHYINDLFDMHAKLLFVRVDIHYAQSISAEKSLEEAISDRDTYLRHVKREFQHLIGFIWRMEYGKGRGYHHHLMFIFNGAKLRNDIHLGRQLGELWKSLSREPRTYFNCNARRNEYKQWETDGIGMVTYDDTRKRQCLQDYALSYLLKHDPLLLAMMQERRNGIGRMQLPTQRGRGGRPRIHRTE